MLSNRPVWARNAAATGLDFAILIAITAVISEIKDIERAADVVGATNEVFGAITLLTGLAAVCLWWFAATLAARMRQLEGGSGRLAAAVNGSGSFIAAGLVLAVGALFAARNYGATDLGVLATGILDGPTLLFPAAVFVGASGLVGIRAEGLPTYSRYIATLSVPLAAAYLAFAGLQIFKYYAWINEVAYITFILWTAIVSIIGVIRWTGMDGEVGPDPAPDPVPLPLPGPEPIAATEEFEVRRPRPARKPSSRKSTKAKPAAAKKKPTPRKR